MTTPATGPQASTRGNAHRRPSYIFNAAQSVAALDHRIQALESRRGSNSKHSQSPTSARSTAATALDKDFSGVADRMDGLAGLMTTVQKSNRQAWDRISFMENVQHTTEDRLQVLEDGHADEVDVRTLIADQLRSRDLRIERLEKCIRDRDLVLKHMAENIKPYTTYVARAEEADVKLRANMAQIQTLLGLKQRSEIVSPPDKEPSSTASETPAQAGIESDVSTAQLQAVEKTVSLTTTRLKNTVVDVEEQQRNGSSLPVEVPPSTTSLPQSADEVAKTLIEMLGAGASLDVGTLRDLYETIAKDARVGASLVPRRDTPVMSEASSRQLTVDSPTRLEPGPSSPQDPASLRPSQHSHAVTPKQNMTQSRFSQKPTEDISPNRTPLQSALQPRKRGLVPDLEDNDDETPRKRVRIRDSPTPDRRTLLENGSRQHGLSASHPAQETSDEDTMLELRRTPRASQPRVQPKGMMSWQDVKEKKRAMARSRSR